MTISLKENTIKGVNWSFLKVLTVNVTQFLVGIVLARLIAPEKFGLIGMAMIFISFANIFSTFGINSAIIQKKEIKDIDIKTGLFLSMLFGITLYFITYILAPYIAFFFDESKIINLLRFLGFSFPIRGITSVCLGILMRRFNFKEIFYIELISYLFGYGATTVVLAFLGYGVWALAIGSVSQAVLKSLFLIYKTRYEFRLGFDFNSAKELLFFGSGVSSTNIFNNISGQIDYIIVGKFMSAIHVGLYTKAFNLMRIPLIAFSNVLGKVLLTSYSSMQDDKELLRRSYYKSVEIINLLSFPLLTGMVVCADYIIVGLYGNEWTGAISAFRMLCFAALFKVTLHSSGSVAKSQGYVYAEARRQLVYALIIGIGVLIGAQYNLTFVSLAIVIGSAVFAIMMFKLSLTLINGNWTDLLKLSKGGIVLSIPVAIADLSAIFIFNYWNLPLYNFYGLIILIFVSAISLFTGIILIPEKHKGTGLKWILRLYGKYLPERINEILLKWI